jgi:tRNA A-37 threonylcarbamoyl transferase component Bud32
VAELDRKLRAERTRSEAKLLHKAKLAGVDCPAVLEVGEFEIIMSLIRGKRPKMNESEAKEAGMILAKLHSADIIHGDYTPANLIVSTDNKLEKTKNGKNKIMDASSDTLDNEKMFVIDFGLGFISNDVEDKAVDVFTMLRAIGKNKKKVWESFLKGYSNYSRYEEVMRRVEVVEKRVRYAT